MSVCLGAAVSAPRRLLLLSRVWRPRDLPWIAGARAGGIIVGQERGTRVKAWQDVPFPPGLPGR